MRFPPRRHAAESSSLSASSASGHTKRPPHIVIVGAGFGGLAAAKRLTRAPVQVTLIDRRNHHLFQPLLYQVATAGLSPNQIAMPIRSIFRDAGNVTVLLGEVLTVDTKHQEVELSGQRISYDYLVLATGARTSYARSNPWQGCAPGLKSLEDAIYIRGRILLAFERAEMESDPEERKRLLTFVIVGAGPTGVELAGAIAEIAHHALAKDFRNIVTKATSIIVIESGPCVLPGLSSTLSKSAQGQLQNLGVEVRLCQTVTGCDELGVLLGAERIEARTVLWAAGVKADSAARLLGIAADVADRVPVNRQLEANGLRNVFVIGDAGLAHDGRGGRLPLLASVAKQQGEFVGGLLASRAEGRRLRRRFRYKARGRLATIGRRAAVAQFGPLRLAGQAAWLVWSIAHIFLLVGFRNRLSVAASWLWAYFTFERGARLITGDARDKPPD